MKTKHAIILFLLPLFYLGQVNDAGLWLSANLDKRINEKFRYTVNPEFRFNENLTELGTCFLDQGLEFKLAKRIRISANYRYAKKRRLENYYANRHRFYFDASYKLKLNKITLSTRLRWQGQFTEVFTSDDGLELAKAIRFKSGLKLDLEKVWQPFFTAEVWYSMSNKINQFNGVRFCGGVDYELNKFSGLTFSYIIQSEFAVKNPTRDFILTAAYNYSF